MARRLSFILRLLPFLILDRMSTCDFARMGLDAIYVEFAFFDDWKTEEIFACILGEMTIIKNVSSIGKLRKSLNVFKGKKSLKTPPRTVIVEV